MLEILYGTAIVVLIGYGLHLLWLSLGFVTHDRRERRAPHVPGHSLDYPAVTVQLPLYNERLVAATG